MSTLKDKVPFMTFSYLHSDSIYSESLSIYSSVREKISDEVLVKLQKMKLDCITLTFLKDDGTEVNVKFNPKEK